LTYLKHPINRNASTLAMQLRLTAGLLLVSFACSALDWKVEQLLAFSTESCRASENSIDIEINRHFDTVEKTSIEVRNVTIGNQYRVSLGQQSYLELDLIKPRGQPPTFTGRYFGSEAKPRLQISLLADCSLRSAQEIVYDDSGLALKIVTLDVNLNVTGAPVWLNPPLVFAHRDTDNSHRDTSMPAIRVGMVDSGVNYQLAQINTRLARNKGGNLIGYDFWDMDDLPYDAHPIQSEFFVQHHGTRTASLLLLEAPGIELVAYRYPRPDMSRMKSLIEHASQHQATILGMPLGSDDAQDWLAFESAARAHPQMLFIVSAGNNGRDIDDQPVYPAALELDNMLVVTSANDYVRPAERTNWGKQSVDYLIPAEQISLTDYYGAEIKASGSSYAVARMTALVARLKMAHRDWTVADILAELHRSFRVENSDTSDWASSGYIADPLADLVNKPIIKTPLAGLTIETPTIPTAYQLALDILVLDPTWEYRRIEQTVRKAYDLLAQCGVSAGTTSIYAIQGEDYLRDLSTGGAHTLFKSVDSQRLKVVFARDTRMQQAFSGEAFGAGNTRSRPWLRNSVWLMLDIEDVAIALAHELFHVIANSGEHVEASDNLMQSRTHAGNTRLTPEQCQLAISYGLANHLLQPG
jgi:hypothetical protein